MTFRLRCVDAKCGGKRHFMPASCKPYEFETLLAARDASFRSLGFEVVEVTWVLAFFNANGVKYPDGQMPYCGQDGRLVERADRRVFKTAKAARKAESRELYSRVAGPDDLAGWRVMRLTKVIK